MYADPRATTMQSMPLPMTQYPPHAMLSFCQQRPILAERFKTKLCRNHELTGCCPYEYKCMFAHGPMDLRTKMMNVRDGLFTEEAIRAYQRAVYGPAALGESMSPMSPMTIPSVPATYAHAPCPPHHHDEGYPSMPAPAALPPPAAALPPPATAVPLLRPSLGPMVVRQTSSSPLPQQQQQPTKKESPVVRHDPYARRSAWHPLRSPASPTSTAPTSMPHSEKEAAGMTVLLA